MNSNNFYPTYDNIKKLWQYIGGIKNTVNALDTSVTTAQYNLSTLNTAPSSATDTGTAGEIRITATYIYVCTATNTWVRAALSTWP